MLARPVVLEIRPGDDVSTIELLRVMVGNSHRSARTGERRQSALRRQSPGKVGCLAGSGASQTESERATKLHRGCVQVAAGVICNGFERLSRINGLFLRDTMDN